MTQPVHSRRPQRSRPAAGRSAIVGLLTVVLAAVLSAIAPPAFAHNTLVSSNPAADSVLPAAPSSIELVFNQDVKDFQPKIAITITGQDPVEFIPVVNGPKVTADLTGADLSTADLSTADPAAADLSASGAAGEPVSWRVGYRVVSADGHPITGLLNFSVGSGPADTIGEAATSTAPAGSTLPTEDAATAGESSSSFSWWWMAAAGGAAVVIAAGVAAIRLRGRTASER